MNRIFDDQKYDQGELYDQGIQWEKSLITRQPMKSERIGVKAG